MGLAILILREQCGYQLTLYSRNRGYLHISLEDFQIAMKGIYTTSVCPNTIDESPMAYKETDSIIKGIEPTYKILYFMKPAVNIKDTSGFQP